ncbi:hypothetical protein V1460_25220 [Streptomyces sp. SCSIO 30461]|uniref:hypothetical protein n=1 Tax=Streptomyces sp. SCSIO 30461 TaxID=3118085 RepID=UPI0030D210B2
MRTLTQGGLFRRSQTFVDVVLGAHQGRSAEPHNSLGHSPITPGQQRAFDPLSAACCLHHPLN